MITFAETNGKYLVDSGMVEGVVTAVNVYLAYTRINLKKFGKKDLKRTKNELMEYMGIVKGLYTLELIDKERYERLLRLVKGMIHSVKRAMK